MDSNLALAGFAVGLLIGLTGVGSGSVMAPLLIWLGIPPATVVGSNAGYGLITRIAGIGIHAYQGSVDWRWVRTLSVGSIPGSLFGSLILTGLVTSPMAIRQGIGLVLMVTASLVLGTELTRRRCGGLVRFASQPRPWALALLGFGIGTTVGLTSVGSGSLTELVLLFFSPLSGAQVVGTGLAHAIVVTGVSTLAHWGLGSTDVTLVLNLLAGSLPGVLLGSLLSVRTPSRPLKLGITGLLLASAVAMV